MKTKKSQTATLCQLLMILQSINPKTLRFQLIQNHQNPLVRSPRKVIKRNVKYYSFPSSRADNDRNCKQVEKIIKRDITEQQIHEEQLSKAIEAIQNIVDYNKMSSKN